MFEKSYAMETKKCSACMDQVTKMTAISIYGKNNSQISESKVSDIVA